MDLAHSETLVAQLEKSAEKVQLYHDDLETMIATLMEDIYQLSLTGADIPICHLSVLSRRSCPDRPATSKRDTPRRVGSVALHCYGTESCFPAHFWLRRSRPM